MYRTYNHTVPDLPHELRQCSALSETNSGLQYSSRDYLRQPQAVFFLPIKGRQQHRVPLRSLCFQTPASVVRTCLGTGSSRVTPVLTGSIYQLLPTLTTSVSQPFGEAAAVHRHIVR
jgi:hypothetical protein